jgi:hypothetical protein
MVSSIWLAVQLLFLSVQPHLLTVQLLLLAVKLLMLSVQLLLLFLQPSEQARLCGKQLKLQRVQVILEKSRRGCIES